MLRTLICVCSLLLTACPEVETTTTAPKQAGLVGQSCQAANDCETGLACVLNKCVQDQFEIAPTAKGCVIVECQTDAHCQDSDTCETWATDCSDGDDASCQLHEAQCQTLKCDTTRDRCMFQCGDDDHCPTDWSCESGTCIQCAADNDCEDDFACIQGTCQTPCERDLDCPVFYGCESGQCVESGCQADRECVALLRDVDAFCEAETCKTRCSVDADCDQGDAFDFWGCVNDICTYLGCQSDDECRALHFGTSAVSEEVIAIECRDGVTEQPQEF